jgi:hypothetical protein
VNWFRSRRTGVFLLWLNVVSAFVNIGWAFYGPDQTAVSVLMHFFIGGGNIAIALVTWNNLSLEKE